MKNFGNILKELREQQGLSQMDLSLLINIPQATLSRFELNKTEPRLTELRIICDYFNVSADYLLGRTDY